MAPKPRLKYGNIPTTLGGLRFSSRAEAKRYGELLLLQKAGQITKLVVQPKFTLEVNGCRVGTYIGDFSYHENNNLVVEDVKSSPTKTATYQLKKKLMKAVHNIDVVEIETGRACQSKKYQNRDK